MAAVAIIVYLDETGDHSLKLTDREFPIFALTMLCVDQEEYITRIDQSPTEPYLRVSRMKREGVCRSTPRTASLQNPIFG